MRVATSGSVTGKPRSGRAQAPAAAAQIVRSSPTPSQPDEREVYALGLAVRADGDPSAAAEAFGRVDAVGGLLAPLARLRRARALATAEQDEAAADAFEQALADDQLPGVLRTAARLDAAETLMRLSRDDEALALFDAVALDADATDEEVADARWRAARLRREREDPEWAADAQATLGAAPWPGR